MLRKGASATAGAYGAAIGQALIPVPLVGAMIGATVGSMSAQFGYRLLEITVDQWWEAEEFEALLQATGSLTSSWNDFLLEFAGWYSRARRLDLQLVAIDARLIAAEAESARLLDRLDGELCEE